MLQFLLDTDHLTLYQHDHPPLMQRLAILPGDSVGNCLVCRTDSMTEVIPMQSALQIETTILLGHRLEVSDPALPEGATVQVIVLLPEASVPPKRSMLEYLKTVPPGPLLFPTPADADRYMREERDSWE